MIATHNIKVNGRWYRAGEEYPAEEPKAQEKAVEEPVAEEPVAEEPAVEDPKPEVKPRTAATRRKTTNK